MVNEGILKPTVDVGDLQKRIVVRKNSSLIQVPAFYKARPSTENCFLIPYRHAAKTYSNSSIKIRDQREDRKNPIKMRRKKTEWRMTNCLMS